MSPTIPDSYNAKELAEKLLTLRWEEWKAYRLEILTALRQSCYGPESEAVSLLRDILLLPANEQQLEYLHKGIGTATHFAVLLRAEKFIQSLDATSEKA
jgi:hypothetical protein